MQMSFWSWIQVQLIICSLCCSSHQVRLFHLPYFSFPVSFLTHFHHLDVIWGVLKKTKTGHNDQGATRASSTSQEQLGRCLESRKKELWCHIQPHHFSTGHPGPPQWKPLSPGRPQLSPRRWRSICLPVRRCQPVICMIREPPTPFPLPA